MTEHTTPTPTPAEAREALASSRRHSLDSPRDRNVHAMATVLFGAIVAVYIFLIHTVMRDGAGLWSAIVYVLALFGLAWWQTRTARTQPRGVKRTSTIGVFAGVAVGMVGSIALNIVENTHPGTTLWLPATLVALLAMIPAMVAAVRIVRQDDRR